MGSHVVSNTYASNNINNTNISGKLNVWLLLFAFIFLKCKDKKLPTEKKKKKPVKAKMDKKLFYFVKDNLQMLYKNLI